MDEITLKMRKALAFILIWVLMFNSMPMMQLNVKAQESVDITVTGGDSVSDGDVSGGDNESNDDIISDNDIVISSVDDNLFSLSDIDFGMDTDSYDYEVVDVPQGAINNGNGGWDISGCTFPCCFKVKVTPKAQVFALRSIEDSTEPQIIEVWIEGLDPLLNTILKFDFNNQSDKIVYGTTKEIAFRADFADNEDAGMADGREIAYSVVSFDKDGNEISDADKQIACIVDNGQNGKVLVFNDDRIGKLTVTASVPESEQYDACEVTRDFEVVNEAKPDAIASYIYIENVEEKDLGDKNIYNQFGKLCAPSGYEMLETNEIESNSVFDGWDINEDKQYTKVFYLRNLNTGGITDVITKTFSVDTVAPKLSGVEFSQWFGGEYLNSNGAHAGYIHGEYVPNLDIVNHDNSKVNLYYNTDVKITFTVKESDLEIIAKDENGKLLHLEWDEVAGAEGKVYVATHTISKDKVGTHYVTLEINDQAGNTYNYRTENFIVLTKTEIATGYGFIKNQVKVVPKRVEDKDGKVLSNYTPGTDSSTKLYFNQDIDVWFRNTSSVHDVVVLDAFQGQITQYEPNRWEEYSYIDWCYYFYGAKSFNTEGEHKITLFRNNGGNSNQLLETIIIDKTPAKISAKPEDSFVLVQNEKGETISLDSQYEYGTNPEYKLFYQGNVKLHLKIEEANIGNVVFEDSYYKDGETPKLTWQQEGDVWTATYEITEANEGEHQITIKVTDKAAWYSSYVSEIIVVDSTKAQWAEQKVEYDQWLTDSEIIGVPGYSAPTGYKPGGNSDVELYYNGDMSITFYLQKKYLNTDCITIIDNYTSDQGVESEQEVELEWEKLDGENSDIWKATYKISKMKLGEHVVSLVYKRNTSENKDIDWTSEKINIIDTELPTFCEVVYSGFTRVEDQSGVKIEETVEENSINDTMKVYANKELALKFLFEEVRVSEINRLSIIDTYNGERREKSNISWENTPSGSEFWGTTYKVSSEEPGEHIITVEYVSDAGVYTELFTSACIYMDNVKADLNSVTVSSGESEILVPEDNDEQSALYYNQNVEIDFELYERALQSGDIQVSDSYYENSDTNIQYSITTQDDENHIVCFIPKEDTGTHVITLKYLDKCYDKEVARNVYMVIDTTLPKPDEDNPIDYERWVAAEEISVLDENQVTYTLIGTDVSKNDVLAKENVRLFYKRNNDSSSVENIDITFTIVDEYLDERRIQVNDTWLPDGERVDYRVEYAEDNKGKIICSIPVEQVGDHVLTVSYEDKAGNIGQVLTSKIICIDGTAAVQDKVTYSDAIYEVKTNANNNAENSDTIAYYKDTMTVTFEIIEDNFREEDVVFSDSFYKEDEDITYDLNWSKGNSSNCWVGTYTIINSDKTNEGEHILNLKYKDRVSEDYTVDYTSKKIIMDTTASKEGGISYTEPVLNTDEALYYKDSATISFKIIEQNFHKEGIKLVDEFVRNYDKQTFYYKEEGGDNKKRLDYIQDGNICTVTYTVPIDEYGTHNVTLTYNDICQNGEITFNPKKVVMDQPVGKFKDSDIIYSQQPSNIIQNGNEKTLYFITQENDLTVEFTIEEDDFDDSKLTLTDSYYPNESISWKTEVDGIKVKVIYTINKEHEGEHVLALQYQSSLGNGVINEVFDKIIIDSHKAVIQSIEYSEGKMEEDSKIYYNNTTDAKVTFFISEMAFEEECLIITDSFDNKEINGYVVNDNVYPVEIICTIPNDGNGEHQLTLTYNTKSSIGVVQGTTKTLVIDNTQALQGDINYSQWINAEKYPGDADEDGYGDLVTAEEQINLNNIYRLYYKDDTSDANDDFVYVTFDIDEKNFHQEGVTVSATCDEAAEEITWTSDLEASTVTCSIPKSKEGEHVVTLTYQDRCGNGTPITMTSKKIVVDNQVPSIGKIYGDWVSVRTDTGAAVTQYNAGSDSSLYLYYDKGTTLTFSIDEKNFCEEDVVFTHEYSCRADNVGTDVQDITREYSQENIALDWKLVEGIWTATYILEDSQEGQHIFKLSYKDRSNNSAEDYVSEHIIMDKTPAKFADGSPDLNGECMWDENVAEGGTVRKYYKDNMSITFEIEEANFYPKDVVLRDSYDPNGTDIKIPWNWDANKNVWVGTYTIPKDKSGEHMVTLKYQDRSTETTEPTVPPSINYTSEYIVMDGNRSNLDQVIYNVGWDTAENIHSKNKLVKYTAREDVDNVRLYYKNDMVLTFVISEDNFHEEDVVFIDKYQGRDNQIELDWQQQTGSNVWTATHTIYNTEVGEHRLSLTYNDRSGNDGVYYLSEYVMMDAVAPTLDSVGFTPYKQAVDADTLATISGYQVRQYQEQAQEQKVNLYYDDTMTMTFTITEINFNSDDVKVCDNGNQVPKLNWQQQEGTNSWIATHTILKEEVGKHVITLEYQDRALNEKIDYTSETIIIDGAVPEISLTYKDGVPVSNVVEGIAYYGANKKAEISIEEDNFRASDVEIAVTTKDAVEAIDVDAYNTYLKNSASWNETDKGHVAYIEFVTDARYDITITYKDLALQDAQKYESKIVVDNQVPVEHSLATAEAYNTNSEAFKRMVDEANRKVLVADDKTRFIYQDAMTFKFAMKEINFDATQVQLRVYRDGRLLENGDGYSYTPDSNWKTDATSYIHTLTLELGKKNGELVDGNYKVEINYKDLAGHDMITYISNIITIDQTPPDIQFAYDNKDANNDLYYNKNRVATITVTDRNVVSEEINVNVTATDIDGNVVPFDLATKQSAWTFDKETNTWTSKVTYDVDAKYDFTIFCNDMATNEYSDDDSFTVDKLAPSKDSFRFEYSTALPNKGDSNNAFYKDKVTVKIIAEDVTSPVDYFEWTYIKQPGASSINQDAETHIIRNTDSTFEYDETKRTATAEFTLTADQAKQYRGNLRFKATDMAGNTSEEFTDAEKIVVVDTISPTRMVEYSPASQIVNKDTLHTVTGFDYATENVGAVLLYNAPMTVTFKVNEANFYADDIVVKVNDVEKSVTNWTKAGDVWTGSLPISENGEYIVTLQYTDRSTNEMVDYVSHEIVIDTIKPQIHITYGPNDIKQQVEGIKYYDKQQTATITITEHNFRADDIEVLVKATDVNGNNINVTDYDSYLRSRSSWIKQGDTYTAQITYATDANYEFDIMYKDLALIPADDYPNDVFTVDQTAPINVSVSYSSPIYEKTIQGTAYEYYNEPIVVTITAEDDVSGIYSFDYRYFRADGASSVNAENVANKIEAQKITYSNGKKTATATFVIPASELRNGTQINGSMEYVAYNRALTTTEYKDPRRYVVDNIVPNVTVEYNDYVDYENNISYYADDIDVTITVDEANFFADDVKVSVSKDGGEQTTANVSWRNVSVDKHIGSFTLEEEGNYKVYVSYQDPATNKMGEYQSNQLTIDKTKPVVSVSGIRYNSANKKDKIGFVVTAEDINLNTKSFRPKLMAEIRDESGKLNQVDCTELGTIETVVNGKSCTYTIENIDQDGIYRFSCEVSDMSGNITADMMVTDSGNKAVSKLDYSVNRNGSTYGLDESTKKLNNSFIRDARDVIVYETNPDEISNIKITLFKNDKAIVLVEGKDYVVNKISEDGEWYKYEYVIYAANFIEDGTYRISIYSEDKAGNVAENNLDVKNVEINFAVDKTLPNLIVTNLENKETYALDKLSVLMQATDNMKLVNITVELDGKIVATWNEEQIQQMSSNLQDFVFDIWGDSTQPHTVTITLTDIAGNEYVETISDFYVTRNLWIRFINNKVLFYGSIMTCLVGGIAFIPLWKRRKRRKAARG